MSVFLVGKCKSKINFYYILTYYAYLFSVTVVNLARIDREQQQEYQRDKNTTKHNIAFAILDLTDFEGIGGQMPDGTGKDALMANGTNGNRKWKNKNKKKKKKKKNNNKRSNRSTQERQQLAQAIESIGSHESSFSALRLMMEFGSVDDKWQAMQEIKAIASQSRAGALNSAVAEADGRNSTETVEIGTDSSSDSEDESEESSS